MHLVVINTGEIAFNLPGRLLLETVKLAYWIHVICPNIYVLA